MLVKYSVCVFFFIILNARVRYYFLIPFGESCRHLFFFVKFCCNVHVCMRLCCVCFLFYFVSENVYSDNKSNQRQNVAHRMPFAHCSLVDLFYFIFFLFIIDVVCFPFLSRSLDRSLRRHRHLLAHSIPAIEHIVCECNVFEENCL